MRLLIALLLASAILGGVQLFMWFQASVPAPRVISFVAAPAEGRYSLELTLTFDAEPDAFDFDMASLRVSRQGKVVLLRTQRLPAGTPILIEDLPGIVEGRNEFFVSVFVPDDGLAQMRAVRLRLLLDGQFVSEQTLWSPPGEPVQGTLVLEASSAAEPSAPDAHRGRGEVT
jgi:hypothetical protein